MKINHNVNAMITQHALYNNNNAMGKSLEKLSTGLRINRAQDDAAGLAMSEQMRTQIKGLGKAKQNSQDGIAALQIAEGGLAEVTNIMQRQRELAVQAANDTLTSTERKYLDLEFQQLTQEIARIAKTTDYNGKNMLNWSEDPNTSFGAVGDKRVLQLELEAEHTRITQLAGQLTAASYNSSDLQDAIGLLNALATADRDDEDAVRTALENLAEALFDNVDFNTNPPTFTSPILDISEFTTAKDKQVAEALKERLEIIIKNNAAPSSDSLANLYMNMVRNDMTSAASFTLHIGPNYSSGMGGKYANQMAVTYISFNPGSLGLSTKNLKWQDYATEAIDQLDKIIKSVSGVRAKIGTFINRLEYTINNISSLEFNTQDAESRIRDTDFAKETTNFTRNQILVQSATSMLAQANTLPQTALQLIQ
ncbi:MAG: hypothetical protein LBC85_04325 [Fibromonadaceae bacterium]|jgi:flagellin|nr:hypothetical protein [Fibromonadaceae bacterium]